MALAGHLITDVAELEAYRKEWDALAVAAGRPYSTPAWMLAWWHNIRPDGARLRALAALEDGHLVAVAPFWVGAGSADYRLLAGGLGVGTEPLARTGLEREVATMFAGMLGRANPRPRTVILEQVWTDPPWAEWLVQAWPSTARPWLYSAWTLPAPSLSIEGRDYDTWLLSKSRHFRQRVRRFRRRLLEAGAKFRIAGENELESDLRAFSRLHRQRWNSRGGSDALTRGVEPMLLEVGHALLHQGRFRLFSIELDGRVISAHLFIAAGPELSYWLGGFDEAWAEYSPALQSILHAVEDGIARGERRLDLGPGPQDYKYRLADGEQIVRSVTLAPKGARYPLTRLRTAPNQLRWGVSRRLTPETKRRLKHLIRR
jgi:CelD/BcsL family acetyltransferase involved in cellulose biosynthesis